MSTHTTIQRVNSCFVFFLYKTTVKRTVEDKKKKSIMHQKMLKPDIKKRKKRDNSNEEFLTRKGLVITGNSTV